MTTTRAGMLSLSRLLDAREAGGYTLPDELTAAYDAVGRVKALTLPEPSGYALEDAAEAVTADAVAGRAVDVAAVAERVTRAQRERETTDHARRILAAARERIADHAVTVAGSLSERVIAEHLAPAYGALLDDVRRAADALAGHSLEPHALITAPSKVRNAYGELHTLAQRHSALRGARAAAVAVGRRMPEHDERGAFVELRRPQVMHRGWTVEGTAPLPRVEAPADDLARMLWLVTDAAPADPWLPTVAEQDAAFLAVFGAAEDRARRNAHNARAIGAMVR